MFSLYVHVPFCAQVCAYCDFAVLRAPERVQAHFVPLVLRELELRISRDLSGRLAETAYLGGGTPSELSPLLLDSLLKGLRASGILAPQLKEFTVECNPESAVPERLEVLAKHGVDRWSLGVQTFRDDLLARVGRRGCAQESREAMQRLAQMPGRLSCDLMFDLPGQTLSDFLQDLEEVASVAGHISFYGLSVEPRTLLGQKVAKGILSIDEDAYADFYRQGVNFLTQAGMERYEVSNFCRPGEEGIHNRNYWERGEYLGIGPGAHSFYAGVRWSGPRTYARWAEWVECGCPISSMEPDVLGEEAIATELIWLSLRQSRGLDRSLLAKYPVGPGLQGAIAPFIKNGWLVEKGDVWQLQGDGWVFMDRIVHSILDHIF